MSILWRILIPSWRFFDDVGSSLELVFKVDQERTWLPFLPEKRARHWYQLFLNSEGNLRLAMSSLVERLVSEIGELGQQAGPGEQAGPDVESLVTYQLVVNAVRTQILSEGLKAKSFQFQILVDGEMMLTSERHNI